MSRQPRKFAYSQIYHIILKGLDGQDIFYDNQDRNFFLNQISFTQKKFNYIVYSYCLMSNHVHIVIKSPNNLLSKSIQSLSIRYAYYFNQKYKRTGSLFQGRFKSKAVENSKYFLELCRYIHRNPEKAGIALTQDYEWSSYKEYIGFEKIINKKSLLYYFNNNLNDFIYYTTKTIDIDDVKDFVEYELINKLTDSQLASILIKIFAIDDISQITSFFKNRPKSLLTEDFKKITSVPGIKRSQVCRILRSNKKIVNDLWNV